MRSGADVVNGLAFLPLIAAAIVFVIWLIVDSPSREEPSPLLDETDVLRDMGHALGASRGPHRYDARIKRDAAPGLDAVRFEQDGHLIGEILVEAGEARAFLAQVCR